MDVSWSTGPSGISPAVLRSLERRSNLPATLQLAGHLAVLGATGGLVWISRASPWLLPALWVHGVALVFLFCAAHECVHRTAFASRAANEGVAWVAGVLLVLPPEYFRLFHAAHHRHTQDPARDPELTAGSPRGLAGWMWRVSGLGYWSAQLRTTWRQALTGCSPEPFVPADRLARVVREARVLWALYVGIAVASIVTARPEALIYWVVPVLLGQPALRLFLMAEHTGCELSSDMLANTRTTYTTGLLRFLSWRMSFHAEHHCFPAVPFHALPQLDAILRGRLKVTSKGYLRLHREWLKGWRSSRAAAARAS